MLSKANIEKKTVDVYPSIAVQEMNRVQNSRFENARLCIRQKRIGPKSNSFIKILVLDNLEFLEHVADGVWMLVLVVVKSSQYRFLCGIDFHL